MATITIDIKGMTEALGKFDKYGKKVQAGIKNEVNASALKIQSDAKKLAPVNLGTLRNSIQLVEQSISQSKFVYTIGSTVKYAPYVEFGTGGKVSIPTGYESYASQFKGKSDGTFTDMVKALAEWVKKKGIVASYSINTQRRVGNKANNEKKDNATAWAIAISIIKKGLRPQPFLIPAFEQEKPKLKSRILNIIKNAKS
jgi:HK97 gp10 family phage protein